MTASGTKTGKLVFGVVGVGGGKPGYWSGAGICQCFCHTQYTYNKIKKIQIHSQWHWSSVVPFYPFTFSQVQFEMVTGLSAAGSSLPGLYGLRFPKDFTGFLFRPRRETVRWACDEGGHLWAACCVLVLSYKRRRLGRRGEHGKGTLNAHAERRPVWTSSGLAASVDQLGSCCVCGPARVLLRLWTSSGLAASVDQLGYCCVCGPARVLLRLWTSSGLAASVAY